MNIKTFTKEFTSKIAGLSNLDLDENEISYFTSQFNKTLDTINNLSKVDTKNVKEAYNISGLKNIFREDVIDKKRMLSQEEALSGTKRKHNGFFVVKGILNEK